MIISSWILFGICLFIVLESVAVLFRAVLQYLYDKFTDKR
jgi:hypothetical protein